MPKNTYSNEFKADAVELYETDPDMSYSQVAADLGVSRGAIKTWVHHARKAAGKVSTSTADHPETPEDELTRLRVENDSLRADKRALRSDVERLEEERTILRKATKYFASTTTW